MDKSPFNQTLCELLLFSKPDHVATFHCSTDAQQIYMKMSGFGNTHSELPIITTFCKIMTILIFL